MAKSCTLILFFMTIFSGTPSVHAEVIDDVASPRALEAYNSFWKTFESRQGKMIQDAQKKYESQWQALSVEQKSDQVTFTDKMISDLKESATRYRDQLEKFPEAENRPYVILNLAQVLFLLYEQSGKSADFIHEALMYLETLLGQYRQFERWDFAVFLKAQMLNRLEQYEAAIKAWKELADSHTSSVFHVYAHLAIGDYLFHKQKPRKAAEHYKKALNDLKLQNPESRREHGLSIRYRLAWASYRSGSLKEVIKNCLEILRPESNTSGLNELKRITRDAVNLAGDALFELSEIENVIDWLQPDKLAQFSPAVGLRMARRYFDHKDYERTVSVTGFLIKNYPMSKSLPFLYNFNGLAWEQKGKMSRAISSFEKLSLSLPVNSLWRSTYKKDQILADEMTKISFAAAERVALWHMNTGINSRLSRHFLSAASFFDILINFDPGHSRSDQWKLNKAHCYYMSENYNEADIQYSALINETKTKPGILKTASWQLILTRELLWRKEFQKSAARGGDNGHPGDPLDQSLTQFAAAVEHYNGTFPDEKNAPEALLMIASACSDQQLYDRAILEWNKVLGKNVSPAHRATALRGVVFANLRGKSAGDTIVVVRRFLRLEDWKSLSKDLRKEFLEILSKAVNDEGKRLGDEGHVTEAGNLMVRTAREFKKVSNREMLFRDGSYFLAIGGNWGEAKRHALHFQKENLKEYRGDMIYLLARCYEYQLRFHQAAQTYFQLVKEYPKHKKAIQSIHRAGKLAVAEDDFTLASQAFKSHADLSKQRRVKIESLLQAVHYALEGADTTRADRYGRLRLKLSHELLDKITSKILVARAMFARNNRQNGINLLQGVLKTLKRSRRTLGEEPWSKYTGRANILLADEYLKSFNLLPLWEQDKKSETRYSMKKKLFHKVRVHYQATIESGQILMVGEARYKLGDTAERFADELASMQAHGKLSRTRSEQIGKEIRQLKEMATNLFSRNMILYDKHRNSLYNNIWFSKSIWRNSRLTSPGEKPSYATRVPHALHLDLPYLWSL